MRSALLLLVLLLSAPASAHSQLPPLPKTGLDFSAVDQFWRITDMLRSGWTPTEAESRHGRATSFSPAGMIVLDALERKYLKRTRPVQ